MKTFAKFKKLPHFAVTMLNFELAQEIEFKISEHSECFEIEGDSKWIRTTQTVSSTATRFGTRRRDFKPASELFLIFLKPLMGVRPLNNVETLLV